MSKYQMARASAILNLVGAVLLFVSFQATSTDFMLVSTKDGRQALCVGKRAMFVMEPNYHTGIGVATCPNDPDAKPAAVINTDEPWLAKLGWLLIVVGFIFQWASIEPPQAPVVRVSYGPRQKSPKKSN
jgi:hypothetical protein